MARIIAFNDPHHPSHETHKKIHADPVKPKEVEKKTEPEKDSKKKDK